MLRPHNARGIQKRNTDHFVFCFFFLLFEENSVREQSHDSRDAIVFEKLPFQNVFGAHEHA